MRELKKEALEEVGVEDLGEEALEDNLEKHLNR